MYQISYCIKEGWEISASASLLLAAHQKITTYKSTADDSGEDDRNAKHYAQCCINLVNSEMDATFAAGVVLGPTSSIHTDSTSFHYSWDLLKLSKSLEIYDTVEHAFDSDDESGDESEGEVDNDSLLDAADMNDEHDGDTTGHRITNREIDLCGNSTSMSTKGRSNIYQGPEGKQIAVSDAMHYAFRDHRLDLLWPVEFSLMFQVRKMKEADEKWKNETEDTSNTRNVTRGRPTSARFLLRAPHPLTNTHLIVKKEKWGELVFAGKPPPRAPSYAAGLSSRTRLNRKQKAHAAWWVANFSAWNNEDPPKLTSTTWKHHRETLRNNAENRIESYEVTSESTLSGYIPEDTTARANRYIDHGRLSLVENIEDGFTVLTQTTKVCAKHRARSATKWGGKTPKPTGGKHTTSNDDTDTPKALTELRNKAEKARTGASLVSRLSAADKAASWRNDLLANAPSARLMDSGVPAPDVKQASPDLRAHWMCASSPRNRTLHPSEKDPTALSTSLQGPMPLRRELPGAGPTDSQNNAFEGNAETEYDSDLVPISEEEYELEAAHWRRNKKIAVDSGREFDQEPPLNVQQREAVRRIVEVAELRYRLTQAGKSATDIYKKITEDGYTTTCLLVGAGGTGKSAVVHAIERKIEAMGQYLLVSAYTGVAAAPFFGPTLLKLFSLGIKTKSENSMPNMDPKDIENMRDRFKTQSGFDIENAGVLVIDEASFLDAKLIGQVDYRCRLMSGNMDLPFGGYVILFACDNMQKVMGEPWYKSLIDDAKQSRGGDDPNLPGTTHYEGLRRLSAMPRIKLWRIMRAQEDPEFINFQLQIRRTDVQHPVPEKFIDMLKEVSKEDLETDMTWLFAPIAVMSTAERDVLNLSQLRAFAKTFGLVLVRWPKDIVKEAVLGLTKREIETIRNTEPVLWNYFVEGAPVNLTETINSVRGLVNGTPAILESLRFNDNKVPIDLARAMEEGGYREITLGYDEIPQAVNVIVGGEKILWHGIRLPDLSNHIESDSPDQQVIPILVSKSTEIAKLMYVDAAIHEIGEVTTKQHMYMLAFALTDFKLQVRRHVLHGMLLIQ